jgi:DNA helicase HerA-like ATPase
MKRDDFVTAIQRGYAVEGEAIQLGAAILEGTVQAEAPVRLPLRTMNRHGLISGATGTGKSKTLSLIAESLSE